MSDSPSGNPRGPASADGPGILAGLPRTRPQRASARRAASRAAKPSAAPPRPAKATPPPRPVTKRAPATTRAAGKKRESAKNRAAAAEAATERAPRQGFEAEPDSLGPVQPPGSTELIASAAELAGELAKAGVSTGARVLKDFLSRLPG